MKAPPINVSSTLLANTFKKPPSRLFRSHFRLAFPIRTHIRYSFFAFFLTFSPLAFRFSKYVCFPHRTTLVHVHMHTTTVSIYWVDTYTHTLRPFGYGKCFWKFCYCCCWCCCCCTAFPCSSRKYHTTHCSMLEILLNYAGSPLYYVIVLYWFTENFVLWIGWNVCWTICRVTNVDMISIVPVLFSLRIYCHTSQTNTTRWCVIEWAKHI